MRFGTFSYNQARPWVPERQAFDELLEQIQLTERLGKEHACGLGHSVTIKQGLGCRSARPSTSCLDESNSPSGCARSTHAVWDIQLQSSKALGAGAPGLRRAA